MLSCKRSDATCFPCSTTCKEGEALHWKLKLHLQMLGRDSLQLMQAPVQGPFTLNIIVFHVSQTALVRFEVTKRNRLAVMQHQPVHKRFMCNMSSDIYKTRSTTGSPTGSTAQSNAYADCQDAAEGMPAPETRAAREDQCIQGKACRHT